MIQVFLSYARSDGLAAATKLRGELQALGFVVWRDIEEMQGGQAWKDQLRVALRQADAVLTLLTPAAVVSKMVEWEWENALTLGKPVIGLLIQPCDVPAELQRLHYHNLSDPATYTLGLARLARDLLDVAAARSASPERAAAAPKFHTITAINSTVGDRNITINQSGPGGLDAAAVAQLVAALLSQAPGDPAVQAEIAALLREMKPTLDEVAVGVADLQAGQERIKAHFDVTVQSALLPALARLDAQQTAQTAAILDALETRAFSADELDSHLAAIHLALAAINARAASIADRQLAQAVQQTVELASDPGLDVKHKLKITLPIVPVLLAYEGEIELGSRLNLREVWQALWARIRGN